MRGAALAAILLSSTVVEAAPRRLGVDEAVQLALGSSPAFRALALRSAASGDLARSVRGRMLPSVHLSEEYQHYDKPFLLDFSKFAMPMGMGMAPSGSMGLQARAQDTNSFVAAADQPLLGLLGLAESYHAERALADAGGASVKVAEAQVRQAVQVGFLRYFEARALTDVARSSEAELADQVKVAGARLKAGVVTNADVLRVQVALANARQQEILARTQGDVARATLLVAAGLSPNDTSLELDEPRGLLVEPGALPDANLALHTAEHARPELKQLKLSAEAAQHRRRASSYSLLPQVDAEAAYVRIDGQVFVPTDQFYVGLKAQWALWEWGASWYASRAERRLAEASLLDVDAQRRQIAVEVQSGLSQSTAAASAVELARATIASAEEAYRVTDALVKAGTATTTDLLDSQSALTGARLNLARAQYEQAIARVSLATILGQ